MNGKIFIGDPNDPIAFMTRKQVIELMEGEDGKRFYRLLTLWRQYHNGFGLPYSGGWMEQPALWMDFISTVDLEYQHWKNKEN